MTEVTYVTEGLMTGTQLRKGVALTLDNDIDNSVTYVATLNIAWTIPLFKLTELHRGRFNRTAFS